MNDSIANTLRNAPRDRSEEVRRGMVSSRCRVTSRSGMSYAGTAFRVAPIAPLGTPSGAALIGLPPAMWDSASSRGSPPVPGRPTNPLLHTSCRQVWIRPPESRPADRRASIAGPSGPQLSSSGRDHITRTGRPRAARASSTASAAASSEALCP